MKGKEIMQKVRLYNSAPIAKREMEKEIVNGWRVHTCTMSSCAAGYSVEEKVLVVYEREE